MQEHNKRLKNVAVPKPAQSVTSAPSVSVASSPVQPIRFPETPQQTSVPSTCQECGSNLAANEFFCESCGAPAERAGSTMQKNWASLWEMHHASDPETNGTPCEENKISLTSTNIHSEDAAEEDIDLFPAELEEIVGKFSPSEIDEEAEIVKPAGKELALITVNPHPEAATEN